VAKAQRAVAAHRESFRMALEAGIPIVAGTDAGSCTAPHPVLVAELELMHAYGMPVEQVLMAATRTAAEVLGRSTSMGTIEPGKQADLLVLEGNPLDDLGQLRAVRHVLRAGRFVAPGASRPVPAGSGSLLGRLAATSC
jgi:imidazolonepropionase-like amidohydrolase